VVTDLELLGRVERTYDALPRRPGVRAEAVGPFELFVREGDGWPFYARPRLGAREFSAAAVAALLARQRELGVPQALEWVIDVSPGLVEAVSAQLPVVRAPLMVLEPGLLPSMVDSAARVLHPEDPDAAELLAVSAAVANLGFADHGTGMGEAGPVERDAAVGPARLDSDAVAGLRVDAIVVDPVDGMVARGGYQAALGAAEIVGVATLPAARRRGNGAAVTVALARHALDHGNDLVFLSAADEDVARIYARIGFRRVGTAGIAGSE
jgi:ribosomal protein S18 acetylase RimI-like enzyme